MRKSFSILVALIVGISLAPASQAAGTKVMFTEATGAPVSGLPTIAAGETLHFVLGNFPTTAGLYVFQAVQPVTGARPTYSNTKAPLWISTDPQASFAPTKVIAFTIDNGNAWGADCAHQQCGLWFEYDHSKSTDLSEDQFVPFSFSAVPTTVTAPIMPSVAETLSVKIDGVDAKENIPGKISYRQVITFSATSASGSPVTFKSYTPDLCPVNGSTVTALKGSGQCDIAASAGSKSSHFPFIVGPGVQTVKGVTSVKAGKSIGLSKESNFGEKVSYKSNSPKICSVSGFTLKAIRSGKCLISESATGSENYPALSATAAITVK